MLIQKKDNIHHFISMFDTDDGHYIRTGVLDADGHDTDVDPFMTSFPELLDIGIMGHCANAESGICKNSGIQCYQSGGVVSTDHMTLENYKRIIDECKGKTFQVALGGRGDPNLHPQFEEILKYTRENNIVPSFTTSGLGFTDKMAELCKEYCGAVAVSWQKGSHTYSAIGKLLKAGVKTNVHYVLSNDRIKDANIRLGAKSFPKGINAVIFLLHKPVGLGTADNVLKIDDYQLRRFVKHIDDESHPYKIGFDSCTVPALVNMAKNILPESLDTCEGGRWSAYISADMKMMPCSFDNQALKWAYDISEDTIQHAWDSPQFEDFRNHLKNSCMKCKDRAACMGGCPICRDIVLCNRKEKDQK